MRDRIRVMIVDDQKLLREGFRKLIELEVDFEVVGVAGDGEEALALAEQLQTEQRLPEVVLMDVRMPHMDGIAATKVFRERWPDSRVVILTTFDDIELIHAGLQAGALGYLLKDMSSEQLATTIRAAAQDQVLLYPEIASKVFALLPPLAVSQPSAAQAIPSPAHPTTSGLEQLTEREREILIMVARGASNKEISEVLYITGGTVKNHLSNILSKLGARDRIQAALQARELGML